MALPHLSGAKLSGASPAGARPGLATGLIERHRSIDAPPFLWTFLFGTTQDDGSVSAVHDLYKVFADDDVAYSSI